MMEVKKLKAEDLQKIMDLGGKSFISKVTPEIIPFIEKAEHYHSFFIDGELHACTGVNPYWKGRGEAWIIFRPTTKSKLIFQVRRAIIKLLDACPITRIEASVSHDENFSVSDRWARSLGFVMDHPRLMRFLPDGSDAAFYSRIKEGT